MQRRNVRLSSRRSQARQPAGFHLLLLLTIVATLLQPGWALAARLSAQAEGSPKAAPAPAETDVQKLLKRMTAGQKVGQLFLVSFQGNDSGWDSQIAELIRDYYVGGVLLTAENLGQTNATPSAMVNLTNQLQAIAFNQPLPSPDATATPVITATVRPPK